MKGGTSVFGIGLDGRNICFAIGLKGSNICSVSSK